MICLWSVSSGFNCWILLLQRFNVGLAVEYSSCFFSVLTLDLNVNCFDAIMSKQSFTQTGMSTQIYLQLKL